MNEEIENTQRRKLQALAIKQSMLNILPPSVKIVYFNLPENHEIQFDMILFFIQSFVNDQTHDIEVIITGYDDLKENTLNLVDPSRKLAKFIHLFSKVTKLNNMDIKIKAFFCFNRSSLILHTKIQSKLQVWYSSRRNCTSFEATIQDNNSW